MKFSGFLYHLKICLIRKLGPSFHIIKANSKTSIDFESICMSISKYWFEAPEVSTLLNDTTIYILSQRKGLFLD